MTQAIAIGPVATAGTGATRTITLNGVTAGHGIAVGIVFDGTISSVTCTSESNLTAANATAFNPNTFGTSDRLMWYLLDNVTTGGNKTITISGFTSYCEGRGFSVSGGNTAGWKDVEGGSTGNSTTASTPLTTTAANDLIAAICASDNSDPAASGTGYVGTAVANPFNFAEAEYNVDVGAAGAKSPQMDLSAGGSQSWGIYAVALKAASAASGSAFSDTNTATVTGSGASAASAALSETTTATVTGTGASVVSAAASMAGTATVVGTGASTNTSNWTAAAVATGTFEGAANTGTVVSAAASIGGTATVTATGAATAAAALAAGGTVTLTGTAAASVAAAGSIVVTGVLTGSSASTSRRRNVDGWKPKKQEDDFLFELAADLVPLLQSGFFEGRY